MNKICGQCDNNDRDIQHGLCRCNVDNEWWAFGHRCGHPESFKKFNNIEKWGKFMDVKI